jgi:quinol monooxygenase YgiN
MLDTHNIYEIEFDIPACHREAFEEWLSTEVVGWVNHEAIRYFEVFRNDQGLSPEVKFVFGFETMADWATFADSDEHEAAVERLGELVENRDAVLWQRASVKLDDTFGQPISDGGRSERCDANAVTSQ